MKFQAEVDGNDYVFELRNGPELEYSLIGIHNASGTASLIEVQPGQYSVLLGSRSFTVFTSLRNDAIEVWTGPHRHFISLADARDRLPAGGKKADSGPVEIRALMPGRVVKLLVEQGFSVEAGQGLIVVEAMKMQNEIKAPKGGTVSKIHARENSPVIAGETLMIIE